MSQPRMLPGQAAYTPEELEMAERFVAWVAAGDPGEEHEMEVLRPQDARKFYVMNSAVITGPGMYEYQILTVETAHAWLASHRYESALRFDETADAMKIVLGVRLPVSRRHVLMLPGDEALIFRLRMSASDTRRINLTPDLIAERAEIGLLTRTK